MKLPAAIERLLLRRRRYKQAFLNTPEGRWILADLCRRYHVWDVALMPGDPYGTHFRDGERNVIVEILRTLRLTEAEIMKIAAAQEDDAETEPNDDEILT